FLQFNFVGKLLGPRGNSLKRLQEETLTKMSILGKGSMKEKEKDSEAYARMGHALDEIKKFLIPDYNDEIRQAQLQELTYLNGGSEDAEVPAVRGKPIARGRGTPTPGLPRGRGGVPPPQAVVPRGAPAPRSAPPGRVPMTTGRGLPAPRARGAPPSAGYRPPPPPAQETYGEYAVVPRGAPAPRSAPPGRVPMTTGRGLPAPRARGAPPSAGYRPPPPPAQETYGEYVSSQNTPWVPEPV
ncbi:UNVERIFIED_CONTAM: hypothetical protein FKN15_076756, partial [Acipenser sinensis]